MTRILSASRKSFLGFGPGHSFGVEVPQYAVGFLFSLAEIGIYFFPMVKIERENGVHVGDLKAVKLLSNGFGRLSRFVIFNKDVQGDA
jgi:hypothetical protein